jgi:hypothetical protein
MTSDDQMFFAWLDGELDGEEAAAMEAKVAADPRLAKLAEQHRALGFQLRGAFSTVAEAPVPERLSMAVRAPPTKVTDLAQARREREGYRPKPLPKWAAMAATLVMGLFIGLMVREPVRNPVELKGGGIYAAASLDEALETQLAAAPGDGDLRVGLTFRDQSGSICRSFTGSGASGLACRDGERWRVRGLFAPPEGQSGEYRMAAGVDPNLAALIDSTMAGEPFDAAQERAARQQGWR